jgi:hypothetical protein
MDQRSGKVIYLESHAYSIDGVCHHEDREGGSKRSDRVGNHLEKRSQKNCLYKIWANINAEMRIPKRESTHLAETEFIC